MSKGYGRTKMFEDRHKAFEYIAIGTKEGIFKNCVHLTVGGGSTGLSFNPYRPYCKEDMLIPFPGITSRTQRQIQNRCPEDCGLFKDKAAIEKAEKAAQRRQAVTSVLKTPFVWFAKLPATTQVFLLFLLIVLFSPRLAKSVIEVIKAFK